MPLKRKKKYVPPVDTPMHSALGETSSGTPSPIVPIQHHIQSLSPQQSMQLPSTNSDLDHIVESTFDLPTSTGPPKKKKRGVNRGFGMKNVFEKPREKLTLSLRDDDMRVYGDNASRFANEAVFDIDLVDPRMLDVFEIECRERYKDHRCRCNRHFLKCKLDGKDPLRCRPETVQKQEDWEWMCGNFESEKFLKRSAAGKFNRAKLPYTHRAGTKSFIATRESQSKGNEEVGKIEVFKRTHWKETTGWINSEAETRYNKMVEMRESQLGLEGESAPQDEASILAKVLGKTAGFIPGIGPAPCKQYSRLSIHARSQYATELQCLRERIDEKDNVINDLTQKVKDQGELLARLSALFDLDENPSMGLSHPPPPPPPSTAAAS